MRFAILPQSRLPFVYGRLSHYSETIGDACSLNKHNFTSPHQSTTKRLCTARHLPLVNWRELISQFPQSLQREIFIALYQIEKYIAFISYLIIISNRKTKWIIKCILDWHSAIDYKCNEECITRTSDGPTSWRRRTLNTSHVFIFFDQWLAKN